jgi:transposase
MGHEVMLVSGKWVKAYVSGNKNDVADAHAVWLAMQQPHVRTVAVKTEAQQAVLAMHRMRQQLVKFRTMQSNGLRGLLAEYGEVMRHGRAALKSPVRKHDREICHDSAVRC